MLVALTSALVGACGSGLRAADLFIVSRTGSNAHARLTLLVNEEGGVRCDGRARGALSDRQLVKARAIQEELQGPASRHLVLPARPGSVLSYYVRDESGSVRFSDNSPRQPAVLHDLQLFVLSTAQQVCHLPE